MGFDAIFCSMKVKIPALFSPKREKGGGDSGSETTPATIP